MKNVSKKRCRGCAGVGEAEVAQGIGDEQVAEFVIDIGDGRGVAGEKQQPQDEGQRGQKRHGPNGAGGKTPGERFEKRAPGEAGGKKEEGGDEFQGIGTGEAEGMIERRHREPLFCQTEAAGCVHYNGAMGAGAPEAQDETLSKGWFPSEEYLFEDLAMMSRARNYFAWQYRTSAPFLGARVIDCGCGIGNLTGLLLGREAVIAVDRDPRCVERLRERIGTPANLHTEVCDITQPEFRALERFRPDSCVCSNVLEHIEDDGAALAAIARVLPAGGTAVLMVPACESLYGPIDRNLGHFRRYSRRGLVSLAEAARFRVRSVRYMNLPGWFGWWLNARIFGRAAQSAGQIEFFDRFVVPAVARLERAVAPPFGQSLVLAAEKR